MARLGALLTGWAVLLAGDALAAQRCADRVAVLPFEGLVTDRDHTASAEALARAAIEEVAPGCVEPRAETVKRLRAAGRGRPACGEDTCRAQWVKDLQARWVFQGVVIGAGGQLSVALSLWGERGGVGRQLAALEPAAPKDGAHLEDRARAPRIGPAPGNAAEAPRHSGADSVGPPVVARGGPVALPSKPAPAPRAATAEGKARTEEAVRAIVRSTSAEQSAAPSLQHAVKALWTARGPPTKPSLGVLPQVTLGAGAAALVGGVVLGLQAQRTASAVSRGEAGCPADAFSACFARRLEEGRSQALWSNVLFVAGGVMTAGGAVMLVWTLP